MGFPRRILIFLFLIVLTAPLAGQYKLIDAFPNLEFKNLVDLQAPYDSSGMLYVVQQSGEIYRFTGKESAGKSELILDLSGKVIFSGEQGLLGMAFHPEFSENGYFYVNYVTGNPRRTVISRFRAGKNMAPGAVAESELVLMEFEQPYSNHNGGQVSFGQDGYLYIATGDGGSGGDPLNNAQNLKNLLGKILRIDVDTTANGKNYGIPADNPFSGNGVGYREEIYAYGLRNPWRFSFDRITGNLWAADVGQNKYEEINIISSGGNYGWRIMEGFHCFNPETGCDTTGLILPVHEYAHDEQGGFSITGGFVYRGTEIPSLYGMYIYGDYVSKKIWALKTENGKKTENLLLVNEAPDFVTSFGTDTANQLYIIGYNGKIYKFDAGNSEEEAPAPAESKSELSKSIIFVLFFVLLGILLFALLLIRRVM